MAASRVGGGQPTGLMAFWANVDTGYRERFSDWHNTEHMCERVAIPGFVAGRRYVAMSDSPFYFMMYETEGPEVLRSDAYMAALNNPTPWTRESLQQFRDPVRNIYQLVKNHGASDFARSPCMITMRFNAARPVPRDEDWRRLMAEWGATRLRHYEINSEISGIQTSEKKIYGSIPAGQKHLLLIELDLPQARSADGSEAKVREFAMGYADTFVDRYRIDYHLERSPA